MSRIQTLEDATEEQLEVNADVCAICYSEMINSAKVINQFLIIFCINKTKPFIDKIYYQKHKIFIFYRLPHVDTFFMVDV